MRPFPGDYRRMKNGKLRLTDEQLEWVREYFPKLENHKVAKAMGISESTLHRIAREYGLTKSEAGLKAIHRRQGKKVRRKLEANGYYASLKGRKPAPEAYEGFRRYVKSPDYVHPLTRMKKEHPKRYKELMKEKAERRRADIADERKRIRLGLRRKTGIHLPPDNYTPSQLNKRYNALRRGYIIPDRTDLANRWCVWYDDDTERAEKFEKNLAKVGFKVLPLPDDEQEEQGKRDESWNRYNQLFN